MESYIELMDGSKMAVKVNMLTVKLISQCHLDKLLKKISDLENKFDKKKNKYNPIDVPKDKNSIQEKIEELQMQALSKIAWCILRSNGRKNIDEDDAMMLLPPDAEQLNNMFEEFQKQTIAFKKKQVSKMQNSPKLMKYTGRK